MQYDVNVNYQLWVKQYELSLSRLFKCIMLKLISFIDTIRWDSAWETINKNINNPVRLIDKLGEYPRKIDNKSRTIIE